MGPDVVGIYRVLVWSVLQRSVSVFMCMVCGVGELVLGDCLSFSEHCGD